MEGGAAVASMEVLVQNLINICKQEISLIRGLKEDGDQLTRTLALTQSYLNDAEKKFISEEPIKIWLKQLEAVAFEADNVLDELNYHHLYKEANTMKTSMDKVLSCFSSFNHIARPRKMAHTIAKINKKFESINKHASGDHLYSILVKAPAAPYAALETDSFTIDPIFIGRDDDVVEIVEMLTTSTTTYEHVFSILPIVGMGGMGKTTLARKVFNHDAVKDHFAEYIWVHVSNKFEPVALLKKIIAIVEPKKDDEGNKEGKELKKGKHHQNLRKKEDGVESREVILKNLQKALKGKNFLLVLDDLWNVDLQNWEDFLNSLSGVCVSKGNGIIVTTRSTEVASIVRPFYIHHLKYLSDEDCWSIIKERTFGKEDVPSEFESIGRKIAKRCQGVALAANVVGGVLRSKSEEEWRSIKENWLSYVEGGDNITKILRLSFDHLPLPSLKKCFAYCSIFPKGIHISRKQLVQLWMAEGFLQVDQSNDMEALGNRFLKLLLQNSLLQVVNRDDYGRETHYGMHNLVHDLACAVSTGVVRARYIKHDYDGDDDSGLISKEEARNLRTLFFAGEVSRLKFSDFKSLHALTIDLFNEMYYAEDEKLPSSIRELIHLRYLNISDSWIMYLPDSIGELYNLQTLRARKLWELPATTKYLIRLRHLHIGAATKLPPEIGRLTSLQTLSYFNVSNKKGRRIEELGSLKNLKGKLVIQNLENVRDEDEARKANLSQKPNLVKLSFQWSGDQEGASNDENVLEGLQPHPNLKYLEISGFSGKRFPSWTMKMAVHDEVEGRWIGLNNLVEVKLWLCNECEEIPMLGHLPHLKLVELSGLSKVRCISGSFYGIASFSSKNEAVVFPALQKLVVCEMSSLRGWAEVDSREGDVKVFPHLEELDISQCDQPMHAPSHFPCLNICRMRLTALRKLSIASLGGLEALPDWLFNNVQNLSQLEITNCPKLIELQEGLHTLNSLEQLIIVYCPGLKRIAYPSSSQGSFTSLRSLEVSSCKELISFPHEVVEFAPSLESCNLSGLSSLKNVHRLIECLQKSPCLRVLNVGDVPVMAASCIETASFCSLRELSFNYRVGEEVSRESDDAAKEAVDGILGAAYRSLSQLDLRGMESLPGSIQHLTALSSLSLSDLGVEELPEWFGNLTSLRTLNLTNFRNLRRLPSVEAMQRLTRLKQFDIWYCPLLRIELEQSESEWRKICHLPEIYVDGEQLVPSHTQKQKKYLSFHRL